MTARGRARSYQRHSVPLDTLAPETSICLELRDHSESEYSAVKFFNTFGSRDPCSQAARLSEQFVQQNSPLFTLLGVEATTRFDGQDLRLKLTSTSAIGAVPLVSPTRGTLDYGLVVQPRFSWLGIGPMLSEMGWRITPTPLRLPLLKRSERRVPPWVLSSMILRRLQILLENLQRRFEYVKEIRSAPRGTIHWSEYALRSVPTAQFLALPCSYPDLRDDRSLKGVIRYALERQRGSLQTQSAHGSHIHKLIDFCNVLLGKVQGVAPLTPTSRAIHAWQQRPLRNDAFREGIQAVEWTAEDRGLAGLGEMEGIPWVMPMDSFFEAFVETVLRSLSRRIGAKLQVGRQRQTVQPIVWTPAFSGSQKSLIPDFLLEQGDTTFVIDAKYKRHFEELDTHSWRTVEAELRERHRNDLFQVLAYANLARTSRVVTCLVYPCEVDLWEGLKRRGRLFHKAEISAGTRQISLWLTAIPMGKAVDEIVASLEAEFRAEVAEATPL